MKKNYRFAFIQSQLPHLSDYTDCIPFCALVANSTFVLFTSQNCSIQKRYFRINQWFNSINQSLKSWRTLKNKHYLQLFTSNGNSQKKPDTLLYSYNLRFSFAAAGHKSSHCPHNHFACCMHPHCSKFQYGTAPIQSATQTNVIILSLVEAIYKKVGNEIQPNLKMSFPTLTKHVIRNIPGKCTCYLLDTSWREQCRIHPFVWHFMARGQQIIAANILLSMLTQY